MRNRNNKELIELVVVFKKEVSGEDAKRIIANLSYPSHEGADSSRGKHYFYMTGPKYIIEIPQSENERIGKRISDIPEVYEVYKADWNIQKD
ncbi:MAG: hypothetical protein Q8O13_01320 [Candidatus Omnitrophota bacterium]|nr:hypothetical protein [Candidatus Omnitrophota bacterium]